MLLVSNTMLLYLSLGSRLKAVAIANSSPEYGFWSVLVPSVEEEVSAGRSIFRDAWISIAPPIPTTPFCAELLTAMRTLTPPWASSPYGC